MDPNSPNPEVEPLAPEETPESSSPEQDQPEDSQELEASPDAEEGAEEGQEEGEGADEEEPAAPAPVVDKHKRSGGFQRKIDRLERQLEQAMAALTQRAPSQQPQEPERPKTEAEQAAEQIQHFVSQRVQAQMAQQMAQAEQERMLADLRKQKAEAPSRFRDFDDALESVSDIVLPPHVHDLILRSDDKAGIMYSLAKNRPVLERLRSVSAIEAAREIGRLEAKLASGAAPQTTKTPVRPPAPPSKVVGSVKPSTRNLEDLSVSEYKAAMRSRGRR